MKKVGIITIHKINNYGAVEQAFALNQYLRKLGYDVKTIDFRTYRVAESRKIFFPLHSLMDIPRNAQSLLYCYKLKKRNKRFDRFLDDYVPMTERAYYTNEELKNDDLDFDYYICGSDQIWNTHCENYNLAFILEFAKNKGKRIAYAASMGKSDINKNMIGAFHEELSDYKAISVRESDAVNLIAEVSGKKAQHVVDPVFLLEESEWRKIARERIIKKPYIFFYSVHGDLPGMRAYVRNLSKETGLPVVVVNMNLREMKYRNIKSYDAGPQEFLSLIANAEYVCTNSFHACAFSIIFKKKFLVFANMPDSRIYSIMNNFGLETRIADGNSIVSDMREEIDYDLVYKKLNPMVEKSKNFLKDSLDYRADKNEIM